MKGFVYCLYDRKNKICRIGKTNEGVISCRISQQKGYYPFPLEPTKVLVSNNSRVERILHDNFHPYRLNGDWFKITPATFKRAIAPYDCDNPINVPTKELKNKVFLKHPKAVSKNHKPGWHIWTKSSYDQGVVIAKGKTEREAWQKAFLF